MFLVDIDVCGGVFKPQEANCMSRESGGMFEIVDYEHTIRCMGRAPYDMSTELFSAAL